MIRVVDGEPATAPCASVAAGSRLVSRQSIRSFWFSSFVFHSRSRSVVRRLYFRTRHRLAHLASRFDVTNGRRTTRARLSFASRWREYSRSLSGRGGDDADGSRSRRRRPLVDRSSRRVQFPPPPSRSDMNPRWPPSAAAAAASPAALALPGDPDPPGCRGTFAALPGAPGPGGEPGGGRGGDGAAVDGAAYGFAPGPPYAGYALDVTRAA